MTLAALQRWFQDQLVRPNARPRRARPAGQPGVAAVIRPSRTLQPAQRLQIYTHMVWLRFVDVLAQDFPTVRHLVGPEAFDHLCRRYLTAHPSRSYTLNVLGAKLPEFLDGPIRLPQKALLRDVARVEWALQAVFDEPPCPVLTPEELQAVPSDAWPGARLRPQRALRLLQLNYRANAVITAVQESSPLPDLGRARTWVVVWRQRGRSWRRAIGAPMYAALTAMRAGGTVGDALAAAADRWTGTDAALTDAIFTWFSQWTADGLFGELALPG